MVRLKSTIDEAKMNRFSAFTVKRDVMIRDAFKKQALNNENFVMVVDNDGRVIGIVTDGDFRRAIWNSVSLGDPIEKITNKDFTYFTKGYDINKAKEIFLTTPIEQIPVLKDGRVEDIIFKRSLDKTESKKVKTKIDIPVVIMAGGFGVRLDPFTRILPKPLIPIGDKPVIEIIMDSFAEYGLRTFFITVNHKAKMIKAYFEDFPKRYDIKYIEEEKPLGTAGALKLLEGKYKRPIIVSNCDTIIEEDYSKILEFHKKGKYILTMVGSMQHHVIPYGVCRIKDGGELCELKEKPQYDFLVNTGMYVINPAAIRFIPKGKKLDIIELIDKLKRNGERVGVYPVAEKSWIDVGQWEEYRNAIEKLKLVK